MTAIERLRANVPTYRETQAPLTLALAVYGPLVASEVLAHDTEAARATLAEAAALLQPPLDGLLGFAEASILIAERDFEGANAAVDRAAAVLERLGLGFLGFQAATTRADIEFRRGNYRAAIAHYENAVSQVEGSALGYDLQQVLPTVYAGFAEALLDGGEPGRAEAMIDAGLLVDPFNPSLWLARARLQLNRGDYVMADASLGFVRASWHDADENFVDLDRLRKAEAALEAGRSDAG
jgi:tetratricopeptide (TPR) repeat protein